MSRKSCSLFLSLFLLSACFCPAPVALGDDPSGGEPKIAVLLLSGMNNHDWRETTPALEEALESTGRFAVTVLEQTETMTAAMLRDFDVIVSNFNTFVRRRAPERDPKWSEATRKALIDFVREGKGHVTVHAGSASFYAWPEYHDMVLGTFKVGQTSHGRQHEFEVKIGAANHPISRGLDDFRTFDELWHKTDFRDNAVVLATAHSSKTSGGSGDDEPVAVAGEFGEGRSFFLVLGHNARAIASDGFRALLTRGTEWAATGDVTIPPPPRVAAKKNLAWQHTDSSLALVADGQTVWRFNHDRKLAKAHFDPLGPVGGPSLTWVQPPDHPWHYGLWFSWKSINGVNYWEEDPQTQRGAGHTTTTKIACTPRADHSARIEMDLSYHVADQPPGRAVLSEQRSIEISAPRDDGSYELDWTSRFTAGAADVRLDRTPLPGEAGGQPWGGYAGLSLRLRNLEKREAVSSTGPIEFSPEDRYRGRATAFDYSGVLDGQTVGVAICDRPENLDSPTPWYAIRSRVMTFFTPAVICYKPHTVKAGESFELRYRLIVHRGRWDERQLRSAHDAFAAPSAGRNRS